MKLFAMFVFVVLLNAQVIQKHEPRSMPQIIGEQPSIKAWEAKGDVQSFVQGVFSIQAGSAELSIGSVGSTNTAAAVAGSISPQTVTFVASPYLSPNRYMVIGYGQPNAEVVKCSVVSARTCTGVFLKSHAIGEKEENAVFFPGDEGKLVRVGGAGGDGNLWRANHTVGSANSTPSMTQVVAISASGADYKGGYVRFSVVVNDAITGVNGSVIWSIWGSNLSSFASETEIYGNGVCIQGSPVADGCPVESIQANWNSRDVQTIEDPKYKFYRVKIADRVPGTHAFASVAAVSEGYVFASTITAYIDTFHVRTAERASHTVSLVDGLFGTDDTVAVKTSLSSVATAPLDFGHAGRLWVPSGTYLLTSSIYEGGDEMVTISGVNPMSSKFIFDPALKPSISKDRNAISYLWETDGTNGVSFGMMMRDITIECNDVAANTCLYQPFLQEDSGLDHVVVAGFNGQRGIYSPFGQNFSYKNVSVSGAEAQMPQQMCFLTQDVKPSDYPQIVTVNSTSMFLTNELVDFGWLTSTREVGLRITVIDANHLKATVLKPHKGSTIASATGDAIHHADMPASVELKAYGGFSYEQGTLTPLEAAGSGDGVGIRNLGYGEFHQLHGESAMAAFVQEVGGGGTIFGMNGNTNTAVTVMNYSTSDTTVHDTNGARAYAMTFDGITGVPDQSFYSPLHVWSGNALYIADRGPSPNAFLNLYGGQSVFSRAGAFLKHLQFGEKLPGGETGMMIGNLDHDTAFNARQGCKAGDVFALGGTMEASPGFAFSGQYSSTCDARATGMHNAISITADNSIYLNRVIFGSDSGVTTEHGFTYHSLPWGNRLHSSGEYSYQWMTDGRGSRDMHFQYKLFGKIFADAWVFNGELGTFTVPHLASSDFSKPGSLLIDTGSGTPGTAQDATSAQATSAVYSALKGGKTLGDFLTGSTTFTGTIPLPKLTPNGSNGSVVVVHGAIVSVTPPD